MPDSNGADNTQQRLEQLEQMDKLLLRAQVLQQDTLEMMQSTVAAHDAWIKEASKRDQAADEPVDRLVLAIADLISRIPPEKLQGGARRRQ